MKDGNIAVNYKMYTLSDLDIEALIGLNMHSQAGAWE
jgi:hypothetical protein